MFAETCLSVLEVLVCKLVSTVRKPVNYNVGEHLEVMVDETDTSVLTGVVRISLLENHFEVSFGESHRNLFFSPYLFERR